MTTRKVTAKDGAAAIAMLDRERKDAMTTKTTTTELRHCTGSARFGIEPHEAPIADFPKQPSRKDGLGTMCTEHWKAYVKGLAAARKEAKPTTTRRPVKAPAKAMAKAEALIAKVDALPAAESAARWSDPDVQAALELVGDSRTKEGDAA